VQVKAEEDVEAMEAKRRREEAAAAMQFRHDEASAASSAGAAPGGDAGRSAGPRPPEGAITSAGETYVREGRKVGRNEPCPCGSGQKFKHCHGKLA
jgi:preprotein translocase subunit SecA